VWSSIAVLRGSSSTSAHGAEALSTLEEAASQIRTLSMQLRAFGPGRGQIAGRADLPTVLKSTVRMLAQIFPGDIQIALEDNPAAIVAMAESELQRILINLAINARDAMEGGGKLTIRSRLARLGDTPDSLPSGTPSRVSIEIRDTGGGMTAELQQRVFEPFFTTKGERGTGLGLSSVRQSVEAADGTVRLDSQVGAGTTVTLVLPLAKALAAASPSAQATGPRALVVEEPAVRAALMRALRGQGFTVLEADTAGQGLAALCDAESPFSMLVVGSTPADEARRLVLAFRSRSPGGQVILCENVEGDGADRADGITTLLKPFTLPELLRHLKRHDGPLAGARRTP
jgi:hypothetical protein